MPTVITGLPVLEDLLGQRRLLGGDIDIALAIADAHEQSENRDIVGSGGGSFSVPAFTKRVSARNVVTESKRERNSRSRSSPGYGSGSA